MKKLRNFTRQGVAFCRSLMKTLEAKSGMIALFLVAALIIMGASVDNLRKSAAPEAGVQAWGYALFGDGGVVDKLNFHKVVSLTATTTLTSATHAGHTNLMNKAGAALTFTLPAASGTGEVYKFVVGTVNSSNYVIKVANASDIMKGWLHMAQDDVGGSAGSVLTILWKTAADSDTITLNATTQGGLTVGDEIILIDAATNTWALSGTVTASNVEVTPFSATV